MSDFTPGPWEAQLGEAYYVTGPDLGRVAMMMHLKGAYGILGRRSGDEVAANARLIAAAPDLLEALREIVAGDAEAIEDAERIGIPFPDEMLATYNKACAAIARATGEHP